MPQRHSPASSEQSGPADGPSAGARGVEFVPTPNPNALKCMLSVADPTPAPHDAPALIRSYRDLSATGNDTLARALMSIDGVTSVLISDRWFTINKRPDAAWEGIRTCVEALLREQTRGPKEV